MAIMGKPIYPAAMEYQEHGDENHSTYLYDKNSRFEVSKGTRCACVQLAMKRLRRRPEQENLLRLQVAEKACLKAVHLWEQRWGTLDWFRDCPQFLVTHSSIQVVVEMRVDPH